MAINEATAIILLTIFMARIVDVSLGTLRIIFLTRGLKYMAAVLGFAESLIWIIAISQIMNNVNNIFAYLAFAAGFASGNVVGVWLEEKIALGCLVVRIITARESGALLEGLRSSGFAVTNIDAEGEHGQVDLLFTIVRRKELPKVTALIRQYNPSATYTVEDVRFAGSSVVNLVPTKRPFALRRPHILRT